MRKLAIGAGTLGVLVLLGVLRAVELRGSYAELIVAAERRATNLSLIASEYIAEAFASGDAALRQLAVHSRRVGGPNAPTSEWTPSLASARAGLTGIGAIIVTDLHGTIRHSTRPEIVGQTRATDAVHRDVLASPDDDLVAGTPFRTLPTGPNPSQLIIPIGRRLTNADGKAEGVVVASFIPAEARGFFRSIDVGQRGTVWVFHPDGVVLFREPSDQDAIGESARDNPIFAAAAGRGGSGTLHGALTPGSPVLLTAFHTMARPQLVVAVSLDRDEILTAWYRDVNGSAMVFGVLTMTLGVMLFVLYRQMDAKATAERELRRTREIESDRLRESNDRLAAALEREQGARRDAEAASALKDQFLMTVSHELRTPLTAIYGWARMLNQGAVSERHRGAALRTIERNAHMQTRLIDDLLDVSRVMGGKLRLDLRPVNIAEVVHNAVDTVRPAADAKGVRLQTAIDLAAGRVLGDRERLQQIAWNLVSNAVKFTPAGGRVGVSVRRVENEVGIVVSDTGVGISPEFLPHVFERFRQEDAGTKRRFSGLGLGLAIVRNLVELHGGTVTAHSDGAGHGSTFTVRLPSPAAMAPSSEPEMPMTAPHSGPTPLTRLDAVRVLVVDDDKESRELFAAILEAAGATVTSADSAENALTIFRGASYDVLVSDIEMPDVDGYALVRQALAIANERGERLGAIAVTAYTRVGDEARSLRAGFQRHVQKPLEPAALVAAVAAVSAEKRISSG